MNDVHTPTPSQAIMREYLASGHYRHRLHRLQSWHLQSRNVMLEAIATFRLRDSGLNPHCLVSFRSTEFCFGWGLHFGRSGDGIIIGCMIVLDVVHPPAVSTSLSFAFQSGAENNLFNSSKFFQPTDEELIR